jgi:hypothetical protein
MATTNALVAANPFSIPAGANTPVRPFEEFASGYKTGRSVDGATLYEPSDLTPIFAEPATVPIFPWKANPQVGHLKGLIRNAAGLPIDTGAITIVRVSGDDSAPGRRSVTTATDGSGFYGGVDLAVGRYQVAVTPVRESAYVHQCAVDVLPGQVSTLDFTTADAEAPVISLSVTPDALWPPNGTLSTIAATITASDASSISLRLAIQDEYGRYEVPAMTTSGAGALTWKPSFALESARDGEDRDGRVYTIVLTATDEACNTATTTATVLVAHDMRDKK